MCKLAVKEAGKKWIFTSDLETSPPNFLLSIFRLCLYPVRSYIISVTGDVQATADKVFGKDLVHVVFLCGSFFVRKMSF